MDAVLLITIGGKVYEIAKNVAPHLAALKTYFEERGIEHDREAMNTVVIEAAERQAVSDAQVAAGSDPAPAEPGDGD